MELWQDLRAEDLDELALVAADVVEAWCPGVVNRATLAGLLLVV